jgi:type III pantothenate kinase
MTVLLAVDVGNSQTKLGWFENGKLSGQEHFPAGSRDPAEAIAALTADAGIRRLGPTGRRGGRARPSHLKGAVPARKLAASMCSVVPDATPAWRAALREACGAEPLVVAGDTDIGMVNHYADPASLGPDRLVGALAARELHGAPVIVVSLGTATVVDAVSRAGEYLGGAIAPGVETSLAALAQRAARLLPVRFEAAPRAIATDTRAGMIAGAFFGAVGQIRELLAGVRAEMGEDAPAVLTGGRAELVAREVENVAAVEPALTLLGLRLAWEYASRGRA